MAEVPYRVEKPWGYELIWARTDRYVGKVLHVRAGHVLSLQYHNRKDETMHVLRGELILRTGPGDALEERALPGGRDACTSPPSSCTRSRRSWTATCSRHPPPSWTIWCDSRTATAEAEACK